MNNNTKLQYIPEPQPNLDLNEMKHLYHLHCIIFETLDGWTRANAENNLRECTPSLLSDAIVEVTLCSTDIQRREAFTWMYFYIDEYYDIAEKRGVKKVRQEAKESKLNFIKKLMRKYNVTLDEERLKQIYNYVAYCDEEYKQNLELQAKQKCELNRFKREKYAAAKKANADSC